MKTGTTEIARQFSEFRRQGGGDANFLYPIDDDWFSHSSGQAVVKHHELRQIIHDGQDQSFPASKPGSPKLVKTQISNVISRASYGQKEKVIFVWEGMLHRIYSIDNEVSDKRIERLERALSGFEEVEIVYFVRQHLPAVRSFISQQIRHEGFYGFKSKKAYRAISDHPELFRRYRYSEILEFSKKFPSKFQLSFVPFLESDIGSNHLMERLSGKVDLRGHLDFSKRNSRRSHSTPGAFALNALLMLKKIVRVTEKIGALRGPSNTTFRVLRELIIRIDAAVTVTVGDLNKWKLSERDSQSVLEFYKSDAALIANSYPEISVHLGAHQRND